MSTPLSSNSRMNDPATGGSHSASSVGGGGGSTHDNKSINSDGIREPRKKTTSLWSYILPLTNEQSTTNNNTKETPLPTTSPSDRNAVSIRLALGDTQASVQQLADRVDRVLDQQRIEAKNVERLIGGVVKSVERAFTAVAESNAAHTSKLEEALSRCAKLEETLSAQSKAITDLGARCDATLSNTTIISNRLQATHDNVMSLLPAIPMLQTVPTEIQNSELKITAGVERALDRAGQNQHQLLAAETRNWMAEYQKETSASLDKVREEMRRELQAWSGSLSLHRQEMNALFSAALAGIRNVPGTGNSITASASESVGQPSISMDQASTGQDRESGTPQAAALSLNTTHTTHEPPHGVPSSSGFVTAQPCSEKPQVEHAAKNPNSSSRHIHTSPVHDKNSTQTEVLAGRLPVEDTQSTALSSLPDEDPPESMTFGGRGFGSLNKRTGSAFASFTNLGSPGFTVHRRPFVRGSSSAQPLKSAPGEPGSSALQAGISESARANTLGRSSPNGNIPTIRLNLGKRHAGVEDVPLGPTKRSRKAGNRVLMSSQELWDLESSPER